jgi:TonB family protein
VVTEFAEENLAVVPLERALTAEETLELLQSAADVLTYLHRRGLVHGSLKPSNVFAVKDTLKLSSDAVSVGDASRDLQTLAATAVHALTQQPLQFTPGDPETDVIRSLPEPFPEIARNCIGDSGGPAWSAAHLAEWLQLQRDALSADPATATRISRSATKRLTSASYAILLASILVAVAMVGTWLRNRTAATLTIVSPSTAKPIQPAQGSQPAPEPQKEPVAAIRTPAGREPQPRRGSVATQQEVVRQVLPDIPAQARRTVRGTATVVVRVAVDSSGDVANATLDPGGSRYFGRLALEAAHKWRFVPNGTATPREWSLRFEITRTETTVLLEKLAGR